MLEGDDSGFIRVGLIQMCSTPDMEANISKVEDLIVSAISEGTVFVATPETTNMMGLTHSDLRACAQSEDKDISVLRFCALARRHHIWLLIGSVILRLGEDLVNRSLLISPMGEIAARYDKIHLFDVDLPNGESYRESSIYRRGSDYVFGDLPWFRLGMSICYDVRFPYLYRSLAHGGATVLSVPSAFTRHTGRAHWHILLRARAIETGCFILAPAQTSGGSGDCLAHGDGRETYGHSLIISPWGEILAEGGVGECVLCADIDLSKG